MIELIEVSKNFGSKEVVKNISFFLKRGEKLVLLGTSGCGKTTTLKMINRLVQPSCGIIKVNGKNIMEEKPVELRRQIGYVIQSIGLFPHYTVQQNIGLVPQLLKWEKHKIQQRNEELLNLLSLPTDISNRYPHELSGGQQQRVGIARAIAADPPVVLLDEPFGALDPITRHQIQEEFKKLETLQNKTIVLVTHDVFEAVTLGDKICLMDRGEIQQIGTAKELVFTPKNEFVSRFFDGHRFQLELQVVTLKDILKVATSDQHTGNEKEIEVSGKQLTLPENTSLLQALEALEKVKEANAVIQVRATNPNSETYNYHLNRQQILSYFYEIKEKWMRNGPP